MDYFPEEGMWDRVSSSNAVLPGAQPRDKTISKDDSLGAYLV